MGPRMACGFILNNRKSKGTSISVLATKLLRTQF
jgi:hypothetical protein